jgi:CubicO group peptidase (beta-lactamase class C family)
MFINAYDMARFGWLTLNRGKWNGKQLLSEEWIKKSLTPTVPKKDYGYMNWFLNTDRKFLPSAPATAFTHVGNGNNLIYVDPEHELVAVIRWIDGRAQDGVIKKILEALPTK